MCEHVRLRHFVDDMRHHPKMIAMTMLSNFEALDLFQSTPMISFKAGLVWILSTSNPCSDIQGLVAEGLLSQLNPCDMNSNKSESVEQAFNHHCRQTSEHNGAARMHMTSNQKTMVGNGLGFLP